MKAQSTSVATDIFGNSGSRVLLYGHPAVKEKLNLILKNAPNMYSAEVLLRVGSGSLPKTVSLKGSMDWIEQREMELFRRTGSLEAQDFTTFEDDDLAM